MKKSERHLIFALAAALTLSASQALAQAQAPLQPQQEARHAESQFDRQTLEKYAAVAVEVEKIHQEAAEKLLALEDRKQAEEMRQEAVRATTTIIENQGLDVPTYNKIAQQVAVDPELRKEIEQISQGGA